MCVSNNVDIYDDDLFSYTYYTWQKILLKSYNNIIMKLNEMATDRIWKKHLILVHRNI